MGWGYKKDWKRDETSMAKYVGLKDYRFGLLINMIIYMHGL